MASFTLDSRLDGAVGGKTASALDRAFGMKTVGDLLMHYPRRYARRGELTQISSLPVGESRFGLEGLLRDGGDIGPRAPGRPA